MTDKELKKLNRRELLEMLILQTRKTEELQQRLEEAEQKLQDKQLLVENAGSMANAVMQLNGVFDAARAASEQYLENIARMEKEAEAIVENAKAEADKILQQACRKAAEEIDPGLLNMLGNKKSLPKGDEQD